MKLDSLNILRAVAIIFVVIGHFCLQFGFEPVGRFCCYLFVQIFFLISALLLGLKYGCCPTEVGFLYKRWKRLSIVYYPFLLISIAVLYFVAPLPSMFSIVTHFTYVNYFVQTTLCGVPFGHLWYISMLMMCYLMVAVFNSTFFYDKIRKSQSSWVGLLGYLLMAVAFAIVSRCIHIPSRIAIVLISYLIVFVKANDLLDLFRHFMKKRNGKIYSLILFTVSNSILLSLFLWCDLNSKLILRDFLVLAVSFIWLLFFMTVFWNTKCVSILNMISGISFELYLIHHPFVLGKFSWLNGSVLTKNVYLNAVLALFIVILLSILLNRLSKMISRKWG